MKFPYPDQISPATSPGHPVTDAPEVSMLHHHLRMLKELCYRCETIDKELSGQLDTLFGPVAVGVSPREQTEYDLYTVSQAIDHLSEKVQTIETTLQRFY